MPGEVAHLAAGPGFGLAVEMQHQVGLGEQGRDAQDIVADQVLHDAVGMPGGIAERQAGDGADMLLELRDGAGGFRPVAGIVNARRDLVGQQRAVGKHEELDADDADIVERRKDREAAAARAASAVVGLDRGRHGRGVQDAVAVDILGRIVGGERPSRRARR